MSRSTRLWFTLTAGMHLPFVDFTHRRIALDRVGRMREDPGGIPLRLAATADYPAFMTWLASALDCTTRDRGISA